MPLICDVRRLALYWIALPFGIAVLSLSSGTSAFAQPQSLTLSDVLERTIAHDPVVKAGTARVRAAEAGLDQANTSPNPVFGLEVEDFAGSGNYSNFDETATTLYYEELWERGGKRKARTDVAGAQLDMAQAQKTVDLLDLMEDAQIAWVEALAAQLVVEIAQDRLAAIRQLEREIQRRTKQALDPQFVHERILAAVAQAELDAEQAHQASRTARTVLASYWGGDGHVQLSMAEFTPLLEGGQYDNDSTNIALLAAARDTAAARFRFEKANSVQDVSLRAGLRHFSADDDVAVVFGVSIPLGVYDTNRGNIERAQAEQLAAEIEIAAARKKRQREIDQLTAIRSTSAHEINRIEAEILPRLERVNASVREGFNRSGTAFTLTEVTEAQRALTEASSRRIDLLRRFHLAGARLDRLNDRHASILPNLGQNQ